MLKLFFTFGIVAIVAASSHIDVAEESFFAAETFLETNLKEDRETAFLQTESDVKDMKIKHGKNACLKLSDSTKKTVKKSVQTTQIILDKSAKNQCDRVGLIGISNAELALRKAKKHLKKAKKALSKIDNTKITWTYRFNQLRPKKCGRFFSAKQYSTLAVKRSAAATKVTKAEGAVSAAKKALAAAKAARSAGQAACYCETKKRYTKAMRRLSAKSRKDNIVAWTRATHIQCVIKGVSMATCNSRMPPVPPLKNNLPGKLKKFACMSQCKDGALINPRVANPISKPAGDGGMFCQRTKASGYTFQGMDYNIVQSGMTVRHPSQFDWCKQNGLMPLCTSNDKNARDGKCLYIGKFMYGHYSSSWAVMKIFPGKSDSTARGQGWYNKHFSSSCAYPEYGKSTIYCNSYMTVDGTLRSNRVGGWNGDNLAITCVSPVY